MRRLLHGFAAVALVATSATVAVGVSPAAPARAASTCTAPSVRIMVDFRPHAGAQPTSTWPQGFQGNGSAGNLVTACVPFSTGMTGSSLLAGGGFTTAGTNHDGPGFVCRINNLPAPSGNPGPQPNEACNVTPPSSAYWSYWHANPDQTSWEYSKLGYMSYHSVPGSVEVWEYGPTDVGGTTGQPPFTPQSVMPAAAPASVTTPPAPGAGGAGGVIVGPQPTGTERGADAGGSSTPERSSTAPSSAVASPSSTGSKSVATSSGTGTPAASTGGSVSGAAPPSSVDIDSIAKPAGSTSSGTPWATLATVGALAVAALVGGGVAWRRKRSSP